MTEIGDLEGAAHGRHHKVGNGESAQFELGTYAEAFELERRDLEDYGLRTVLTPPGMAVEMPYRRRDGSHVRIRYRQAIDSHCCSWDGNEEGGTCLYGLDRMPARGDTIFLVIGEDDCHVTWHYGFEAVGVSAPHDFVPDRDDPELEGHDVIALLEPDGDGDALVERLSLSRHRDRIRVTRLNGFASVASAHLQGAELVDLLDLAKASAVALDAFLTERSELDKLKYPERAEILLKAGERHRATDDVIAVIQQSGTLYERGGELVRLCGQIIVPVEDAWLADYLSRHIAFQRTKINGQGDAVRYQADPPGWLCRVILQKRGERGLSELNGILTAPTLRPDGSLLDQPGFDAATGLLLRPGTWPRIPETPGRDDLWAAWAVLWQPVAEFPYAGDEDRAAILAAMLTATVRRTLPKAPAFSFDAPVAGSGKTLLATCVAEIAGGEVSVVPECREEDELRKRLLSELREGKPSTLLDNIKGQFASSALEAFLTDEHYADRLLGASQMLRLPTNILVLISGNNFMPRGDLWRRIITTRIDPRAEDVERRSFKLDARKHCREHRPQLVAAALTLLRGFIAAGSPRFTPDRLASFEAWDDLIRQCVLWLGSIGIAPLGDPTASIAKAKKMEPEWQKLGVFLEAVRAVMGASNGLRWRTKDLMQKAEFASDDAARELRDVLLEIAGERGSINVRMLGRWIERQVDVRCGGLHIERAGERQRAALWRVLAVDD